MRGFLWGLPNGVKVLAGSLNGVRGVAISSAPPTFDGVSVHLRTYGIADHDVTASRMADSASGAERAVDSAVRGIRQLLKEGKKEGSTAFATKHCQVPLRETSAHCDCIHIYPSLH